MVLLGAVRVLSQDKPTKETTALTEYGCRASKSTPRDVHRDDEC